MKRYDPIFTCDQGCEIAAQMKECPDGDWISHEDALSLVRRIVYWRNRYLSMLWKETSDEQKTLDIPK